MEASVSKAIYYLFPCLVAVCRGISVSSTASSSTAASHHANATDANAPLALEPALEVSGSTILYKHIISQVQTL